MNEREREGRRSLPFLRGAFQDAAISRGPAGVSKSGSPRVRLMASWYWAARAAILRMPEAGHGWTLWESGKTPFMPNVSLWPCAAEGPRLSGILPEIPEAAGRGIPNKSTVTK